MDDLAGQITPNGHKLAVRIYYEDTDFTGVVYHARYLHFMERGRSDYLRLLGVHHHELEAGKFGEKLAFAVRKIDCDFLKPARIDDIVTVESTFSAAKGARVSLMQKVVRGEELLIEAHVDIAVINGEGRPRRLPKALSEALIV